MRKLMWFSIGFCAACVMGAYLISVPLLLLLGACTFAVGVVLLFFPRIQWRYIAALVCLGLSVGQFWYCVYDAVHLAPARAVDGETMTITLEAKDFSFDTDYGIAVDGTTSLSGQRYHVRMYLNRREPLSPGDQITGDFRLRYTASGGKENPTYHSGNGVLLLAYPRGEQTFVSAEERTLHYLPAYLRQYLLGIIDQTFPEDATTFCKALLLGDTYDLSYETETDLSISGIRHVAAVSGLHVSILFSVIYLFSGRKGGLTMLIGVPVLLLFAAMAGFSVSIVRATIMQMLMLTALLFKKEYDPPTSLAFAVLVMLTVNPLAVTSVGLQLSVSSVAGILLFSGKIRNWLMHPKRLGKLKKGFQTRIGNAAASSVSVSLGAFAATTPLTAWYFGKVSLLSVVTNLLCLWAVTVLFCGIIAVCLTSMVWLPLGRLLAALLAWLVRYILGVSAAVAGVPLAAVYTQSPYVVAWLVFCYLLLAVFLISKQKQPIVLGCCAIITLCVVLLASWIEPLLSTYRVTLLDVGQGQCVLLQSQGKTYMVDCGGDDDERTADLAADWLLSQGIQRLDGLILTHYDRDHVGAAGNLLYRIDADMVVLPEGEEKSDWENSIVKHHTGHVLQGNEKMQIRWGTASITIYPGWNTKSSNESSLCVLFQTEKCDILITGDRSTLGEEVLLHSEKLPQLDALIVGHHGASSSTGDALLKASNPATALISVGRDNSYGHPSQTVLDRLQRYGCSIRRTDLEGTIVFKG